MFVEKEKEVIAWMAAMVPGEHGVEDWGMMLPKKAALDDAKRTMMMLRRDIHMDNSTDRKGSMGSVCAVVVTW